MSQGPLICVHLRLIFSVRLRHNAMDSGLTYDISTDPARLDVDPDHERRASAVCRLRLRSGAPPQPPSVGTAVAFLWIAVLLALPAPVILLSHLSRPGPVLGAVIAFFLLVIAITAGLPRCNGSRTVQ
jgi:hypothetical protein